MTEWQPTRVQNAIYDAHVVHGYKLAEIARELRFSPATVSKIFRTICKLATVSL